MRLAVYCNRKYLYKSGQIQADMLTACHDDQPPTPIENETSKDNIQEDSDPRREPCESSMLVVLGPNFRGQYEDARGISYSDWEDDLSRRIQEISYNLYDLDVALWRDGFDNPEGYGTAIFFFFENNIVCKILMMNFMD